MNLYGIGRTLLLLLSPWALAFVASSRSSSVLGTFGKIPLFFSAMLVPFTVETILWDPRFRRKRRFLIRSVRALFELTLFCLLTLYWWLIFPGHIALAIGAWWVGGIAWALIRYVMHKWALREAVLLTNDYRLFGHRIGKFSKRTKHDRAALYVLAKDSAFPRDTIMTLIGHEPKIYVGAEARRLLDPDELRVLIAHELGHSWSQHDVGCELADWIRRLFFVPMFVAGGSALLAGAPSWAERYTVLVFLTIMVFIWQLNTWASYLLGRPRELAADLYAVEMTRTPQSFATGMAKLVESEPYNVFPNLFDTLGLQSHPCVVKRVRHIAAALGVCEEHPPVRGPRRRPA